MSERKTRMRGNHYGLPKVHERIAYCTATGCTPDTPSPLWRVYFAGRAENGMPASHRYKAKTNSSAHALSHAIAFTEQKYQVRLIEITDASATLIDQTEWDTEDGYTIL